MRAGGKNSQKNKVLKVFVFVMLKDDDMVVKLCCHDGGALFLEAVWRWYGDSGGDSGGCSCGWSIIHGGKGTTKKQNRVLTINACEQALTSRSECKCYFSMLKHTRRCGNCSATSICLLVLFPPQ